MTHKKERGATLVELLVAVGIMGFALALVVGAFSTAVLSAGRATSIASYQSVSQYEVDKVAALPFGKATPFSDCFFTNQSPNPTPAPPKTSPTYGSCTAGDVRADVNKGPSPGTGLEEWIITVVAADRPQVPSPAPSVTAVCGKAAVCVYKDSR